MQSVGQLDVLETSEAPLKWLRKEFPSDRIHVGFFPECLPADSRYDLIYACAVDYCFDVQGWVSLLAAMKSRLSEGGRCLVISASLQEDSALSTGRFLIRETLGILGLRERGQLWGYQRSKADYRASMEAAGFCRYEDGRLADGTYWIEGSSR